jgi:hypothetical protein
MTWRFSQHYFYLIIRHFCRSFTEVIIPKGAEGGAVAHQEYQLKEEKLEIRATFGQCGLVYVHPCTTQHFKHPE